MVLIDKISKTNTVKEVLNLVKAVLELKVLLKKAKFQMNPKELQFNLEISNSAKSTLSLRASKMTVCSEKTRLH